MTTPELDTDTAKVKADFDLIDRLQNRRMREGKITIYTDEPTGELLGGARNVENALGLQVERERWGVLGQIDALESEPENERASNWKTTLKTLKRAADDYRATLEQSAITFTIRAVPQLVVEYEFKEARKKFVEKKTNKVPTEFEQDVANHAVSRLWSKTIVGVDTADGHKDSLTIDDCVALRSFLPQDQYGRLSDKIDEVQFKSVIDTTVVDDADF